MCNSITKKNPFQKEKNNPINHQAPIQIGHNLDYSHLIMQTII